MTTEYLTVDDVLDLHKVLIDEFGGSHGIRDKKTVRSSDHASSNGLL